MVIPTSSADKQNIILKEGQKVMVLKSPKGIYMQLESGKIIAIRTALKVGHNKDKSQEPTFMAREMQKRNSAIAPLKSTNTSAAGASSTNATGTAAFSTNPKSAVATPRSRGANHVQFGRNAITNKNVQMGTAKPYNLKPTARSMASTPDASSLLHSQFPMSNSNSSFDADLSDDSQFLEKLSENLANQKSEDDGITANKTKETKCPEPIVQSAQLSEPQPNIKNQANQSMQSHSEKVNNGIGDGTLPTMNVNDKPSTMQHTQIPNKPEQINHPYMKSNTDSYGSMNNANGSNYAPHQSYNYSYSSNNNGNYNDAQNSQQSQASQQTMQTSAMNSNQSEKYPATPQHVNLLHF